MGIDSKENPCTIAQVLLKSNIYMSHFRRAGRKKSNYAVHFVKDSVSGTLATTKDVSSSGMFVKMSGLESASSLIVGETLELKLFSSEQVVEAANVEVVRITDEGFGCYFV